MDLFNYAPTPSTHNAPLAERFRPRTLETFLNSEEVKNRVQLLLRMPHLPSLILWGPPGVGKTSLARLLAQERKELFISKNAIDLGAKEIREIGESARFRIRQTQQGTLLFIDEIHRLNKAQQDVLLPFVEQADFTLIGATTENPSFEIHKALLSRCRVLELARLPDQSLKALFERVMIEEALSHSHIFEPETVKLLVERSHGDARRLLNSLEVCVEVFRSFEAEKARGENLESKPFQFPLSPNQMESLLGDQPFYFDKKGDQHYDLISAFIKSMRASNLDAAVYYLARMIKGGEDPLFIARRMVIFASEDIGNADPRALSVATSCFSAIERVGLPEGAINLSQATIFLAAAPKSRSSYNALKLAQAEVDRSGTLPPPSRLTNVGELIAPYLLNSQTVSESKDKEFLPKGVTNSKFVIFSESGLEKQLAQIFAQKEKPPEPS